MAKLIVKKIANALIAVVEPSAVAQQALGWLTPVMLRQAELWGGLWVGGEVKLFDDHLQFEPNAWNRLANTGDLTLDVPLRAIKAVSWRRGIVTSIVDVSYDDRRVSFRCFGSKELATTIRLAVRAAGDAPNGQAVD